MTTKEQLRDKITELESQLTELKHKFENFDRRPRVQDAKVGDTLEDGCIVIYNSEVVAVLMAPKDTECMTHWASGMNYYVHEVLKANGFEPGQWFLPTVKLLRAAMWCAPDEFSNGGYYWSNEKCTPRNQGVYREPNTPLAIKFLGKGGSTPISFGEEKELLVRAFRCVFH
jgi:hypothetical protein